MWAYMRCLPTNIIGNLISIQPYHRSSPFMEFLESKTVPLHTTPLEKIEDDVDSPVEEVRLTVPTYDDPTLPCLTFRTWLLGGISCVTLAFLDQFFQYRQNPLYISSVSAQILVLPIGNLMAATLPRRRYHFPGTEWSFSLNPGPFNMKEHTLITMFASVGANTAYAIGILTIMKAFYHRPLSPVVALLITNTTQLLGYGWAGLFRNFLVDSPYMWWPSTLIQVSLFRALHEKEVRQKGGLTRLQFFLTVLICSFAYYIIPNYLFPSVTALSFVCWIWKKSVTAQQIGSGLHGFGVGSFAIDWSAAASFLGSPLAVPAFAIFNMLVGYILFMYVLMPISYWSNLFDAQKFPIITANVYDSYGHRYNISSILEKKTFEINLQAYDSYSKLNLSVLFAFVYGLSFATLAATLTHVALFYGRTIWQETIASFKDSNGDVHTRLMKSYKPVPQWWFYSLLVVVTGLSLFACEGFGRQLQLPWWGVLMAMALAFIFTLPIGVINATTNQGPGLNVISEMIIGYMLPGKPLANVLFKTYSTISIGQALYFLQDFKLGHYMKIPPKSMFIVQVTGTIISNMVCFGTAWWLLTTVKNICDPALLPPGSPWTCPGDTVFYNASIIWGVVGPLRVFGNLGLYPTLNYFFLFGLLAPIPVWYLSKKFPEQKWIALVNMPILISAAGSLPAAKPVHYNCWFAFALFFNVYVYRRYKGWWAKRNYILSAGLDSGVAFLATICYFALQNPGIDGPEWWGLSTTDHCPLADCPTAPGIQIKGCPVF